MWKHGRIGVPTGEIQQQEVLMMFNSGIKSGFMFWAAIVVALIIEIAIIGFSYYDKVEAKYLTQPDYCITACEAEEDEEYYILQVTVENRTNFEAVVDLSANADISYVPVFMNGRKQKPIEEVVVPAYSEITATYRAAKSDIGEDGLVLQLTDTYEPQEWEVELP